MTGGNTIVTVGSIFRAHRRYGGDYQRVYNAFIVRINANTVGYGPQKMQEVNNAIMEVRDYTDLSVLYLFTGASPYVSRLDDIREIFAPQLSRCLRSKVIPERFVSGVNM